MGLGKSHLLSLLYCHLTNKIKKNVDCKIEIPKIYKIEKIRILYINNPEGYYSFQGNITLLNDIVNFIGKDLKPDNEILNQIYDININELNEVLSFLENVLNYYSSNGFECFLIIDQINELTKKKRITEEITYFLNKLIKRFSNRILSASNNEEKIYSERENPENKNVTILSKYFFIGDDQKDVICYLEKLGYFQNEEKDEEFMNCLKLLTNFNPLEMMILNNFVKEENMKIVPQFDDLEKKFFRQRFRVIENVHLKFMKSYCSNILEEESFFLLAKTMDTDREQRKNELDLVNLALMEIDSKNRINSLNPAIKRFFENKYDFIRMKELPFFPNIKRLLLPIFWENNYGNIFEDLCKIWLVKESKILKAKNKDMKEIEFNLRLFPGLDTYLPVHDLNDILNKKPNLFFESQEDFVNTFISLSIKNFELIDFIFLQKSKKNNSLSKNENS